MILALRWAFFVGGLIFFSFGITVTIKVQHLGVHPWDVLSIGFYEKLGLSIGTWNIIIGLFLIVITFILDKKYIKIGTFLNAFIVGSFVDLFLWLDFLPEASHSWPDIVTIIIGIVIMGIGGGIYNAAGVGSGPRDGFMLSISEKTQAPIRRVRIITESLVLVFGIVLGGPVFVFTFIFTFVQSPIFQYSYLTFKNIIERLHVQRNEQLLSRDKAE